MTPEKYVELRDRIALLKARTIGSLLALEKSDSTFTPPQGVRSAASRGLELRAKWKRGGLSNSEASSQGIGSGVQRAVNLKNGDSISLATIRRMHAFFERHEKNYRPGEKESDGGPTAGTIAWLLWGGNAGRSWARSVIERVEKANRWPPGTPGGKGGQFAPKNSGGGGVSSAPAPMGGSAPAPKLPDFKASLVQTENVNSASHNARVLLLQSHAEKGDVNAILGMSFGTNTYGKRQAKLANETLKALGSEHKVAPGQKKNSHAALTGDKPPAPAPATKPAEAPKPVEAPKPAEAAKPAETPKPAGITHSYKKAKNLDEAQFQFELMGYEIGRLSMYKQTEARQKMIDTAPPEKKALYEKWYGPKKVKGVITDSSFLTVLNSIGEEAARVANEFPALAKATKIMQMSPGAKALGFYAYSTQGILLRKPESYPPTKPLKEGEIPWTVSSSGLSQARIEDTFRHEAAHALDLRVHKAGFTKALVDAAGGSPQLSNYMKNNVSKYGASKPVEATAELVALYTAKNYTPGRLPKAFEDVLAKYLKGTSVSKAIEQIDENFVSIDIPEPPEGYELVSADGIDIRFRAPDGSIVQFVDMVEAGLFGAEEEG